jgi:hypothetical protein
MQLPVLVAHLACHGCCQIVHNQVDVLIVAATTTCWNLQWILSVLLLEHQMSKAKHNSSDGELQFVNTHSFMLSKTHRLY